MDTLPVPYSLPPGLTLPGELTLPRELSEGMHLTTEQFALLCGANPEAVPELTAGGFPGLRLELQSVDVNPESPNMPVSIAMGAGG